MRKKFKRFIDLIIRMLIGFNILDTDSIFAKGSNRTALAFAFWCCENGHTVRFISPVGNPNQFIEITELLRQKNIVCSSIDSFVQTKQQFDILFEISFYTPENLRLQIAKRCIIWFHNPPVFSDMESSVYFFSNFIRKMTNISEVWIPDSYSDDNSIYIERIYNLPVRKVPWIWEHESLDLYCKKNGLTKWNQNNNPNIHCCVLESNNTNTSNCIIPLCIIAEIKDKKLINDWIVSNGENLKNNAYFKNNILGNLFSNQDVSGNFVGRIPIPELKKFKSVLITHQRWKPLKHLLLDAVWLDVPMVHNCEIINNKLGKSAGYYYFLNEIDTAASRFEDLTKDMQNGTNYFSSDAQTHRKLYLLTEHDYKSEKNKIFFTQALQSPLKQIKQKTKVFKIAFSDMWSEFNSNYNFFTLLLEDHIKKNNLDIEIVVDEVSPQLVIFGPFGNTFAKYANIPKIFFSGENSSHIGGADLILSVGHHPEINEQTLRLPLWILEVDWFNADANKIQNPKPIPYEICSKPPLNYITKKLKFCSYIVSNPKNEHRNNALGEISKYKHVDSAGSSQNNMGQKLEGGLGGGGGELVKHNFLQDYKFNICFENEQQAGYITEKYFHSKAAGCIPIYWGDPDLSRDFDPTGGINAHGKTWEQVLAEIKSIDEDVTKWLTMYSIPALPAKSEEYARKQMKRLAEIIVNVFTKSKIIQSKPIELPPAMTPAMTPTKKENVEIQSNVVEKSQTNQKFFTAVNDNFYPLIYIWLDGLINNGVKEENITVYHWSDVSNKKIQLVKNTYNKINIEAFPETDSKLTFWDDYWNPQHYAWKLWIIFNEIEKGNSGIYIDSGVLLTRSIPDIEKIVEDEGVFLLEDQNPIIKNKHFCHETFIKLMNCSKDELESQQLQAGVIGWNIKNQKVVNCLKIAYFYTKAKEIISGEKWVKDQENFYGHRHDQSLLSILSFRSSLPRKNLSNYSVFEHQYHESISKSIPFFHHRGKINIAIENNRPKFVVPEKGFAPSINEAFVINLDRRIDRYNSFKEHHSYMENRIVRFSACDGLKLDLTPEIKHLFRNNDFKWKKAVVGCAVSHNNLWLQLSLKDDSYSYLILEDDVRFHPQWLQIWEQASKMIPADADVIYLGGILPPNKAAFGTAIEPVNDFFVKIKENDVFHPGIKRKYFHSCNYSYILFARGAKKIQKIIEEKGIFTSGDHMIVNHMETLNIYFTRPIVAGCFQDLDPRYQTSEFNNFDRKDNFDSDLWNNNEHFDPTTEAKESIKPSEDGDLMMDDSNAEANTILMTIAQGKIQDFLSMSKNFLEKIYDKCDSNEKNNNWLRVMIQILISQSIKYTDEQLKDLTKFIQNLKDKSTNIIIQISFEELLNKLSTDILGGKPGVSSVPKASFVKNTLPVWYFKPNQNNGVLEREWLEEIIGRPIEFCGYGDQHFGNNKIEFLLIQKWESVKDLINEKLDALDKENKKAILVHISDEFCNDNLEIYEHPAVKLIIRNYIRDIKTLKKIITVPLGYVNNRSLKGNFKKLSERKYTWSFAGSVDKVGRDEMLQKLSIIEPNKLKLLQTWSAPTKDEALEYNTMLNESKFIPCPKGMNYETFRVYEALEAGCIPICVGTESEEHKVYEHLIGNGVILIAQDWAAAVNIINQINSNMNVLDQLQENLTKYWMSRKLNITAAILGAMNEIENESDIKTIHL
jgi:GR25 family glycosyltransferase involved in LPS biosynthesis